MINQDSIACGPTYMTYNVFSGTWNPAQSVNPTYKLNLRWYEFCYTVQLETWNSATVIHGLYDMTKELLVGGVRITAETVRFGYLKWTTALSITIWSYA